MTYSVNWKRPVRDKLADIWLAAPDRSLVSDAANRIDSLLRTSPETAGEQREGVTRLLIIPPLAVMYDVHADDRRVDVLSVKVI